MDWKNEPLFETRLRIIKCTRRRIYTHDIDIKYQIWFNDTMILETEIEKSLESLLQELPIILKKRCG